MQHQMFVVYDSKANAYMQPWFLTQQAMAQRAFSDCVNDPDHNFGRHPEDYTLFNIGEFNDQTAQVQWQPPKSCGNGLEYIIQIPDEKQKPFAFADEMDIAGQEPMPERPLHDHSGDGK